MCDLFTTLIDSEGRLLAQVICASFSIDNLAKYHTPGFMSLLYALFTSI